MNELPLWKTPVAENCFMIGRRNPDSLLQCNTYLRSFSGRGEPLHWCVDPGSQIDYPVVREQLLGHIGDMAALRLFSINHQDPDVVGNLIYLTEENARLTGIVTDDTWRLVRHLNIRPKQVFLSNKAEQNLVTLSIGRKIQFVPTPFCHFRGAMAIFDPESQVLFSGDLFGGLNQPGRVQLYGEEADWPGIAQFHRIYMPCTAALDYAIRQIRALKPRVRVIAPQHGFVLQGDFMETVLDRLQTLPVGMDSLAGELDEKYLDKYQQVLDELLQTAAHHIGRHELLSRLNALPAEHELRHYMRLTKTGARLTSHGIRALPLLVDELGREEFDAFRSLLKGRVLQSCTTLNVPVPHLDFGVEEATSEQLGV